MIHAGINGFGRMGRLGLRVGWSNPKFEVTQIHEIATDVVRSTLCSNRCTFHYGD